MNINQVDNADELGALGFWPIVLAAGTILSGVVGAGIYGYEKGRPLQATEQAQPSFASAVGEQVGLGVKNSMIFMTVVAAGYFIFVRESKGR